MEKKLKASTPSLPVPQTDQQAVEQIATIGRLQRQAARIKSELDDKVAALTEAAAAEIAPLDERVVSLVDGLQAYCDANRDRLTANGKTKTVAWPTGTVSWRARPAKVSLRGKVEELIERIKARGLAQFIRLKEEINKEAMLDNPALARTVPGISIKSAGEDFAVEPAETTIPEVAS